MNLRDQVANYKNGTKILSDWLGDGAHVVPQELAESRSQVCLACPLNQPGNALVGAVVKAIKEIVALKNHLQLKVPGQKRLFTCQACSCVLGTKVWMPPERIKLVTDAETFALLHESCWIRTEAAT